MNETKIIRFKLKELPSGIFLRFMNMYCYTMMCRYDTCFDYFFTDDVVFSEIENSGIKPYIIKVDITGNELV